MTSDLNRELTVYADGEIVRGLSRVCLSGRCMLGLFPMPFTLFLWNIDESAYNILSIAKTVSVMHGDSILVSGNMGDICRTAESDGTLTKVVIAAGLSLWMAPVSLALEEGKTVSETVSAILEASGTGIQLLSFPGKNAQRSRGQSFFGRASECILSVLSAVNARCCLTPSGLCIIPESGLPVSMELSSEDLISAPVTTADHRLVLRTPVSGWPLGKMVSVRWKDKYWEGLVTENRITADNAEGGWYAELLIDLKGY